jgi:hypothetical protein
MTGPRRVSHRDRSRFHPLQVDPEYLEDEAN